MIVVTGIIIVWSGRSCCSITCYCLSMWYGVLWLQRSWVETLCWFVAS